MEASQTTTKPLTLTIIPQTTAQSSISENGRVEIPNFNHVAIQPTIIPAPVYTIGKTSPPLILNSTDQEKIEKQRKSNREYQKKFREKTKGFTEIAHLPSINERIKQVWLLTYPNVNIDQQTMDILIAQFVNSVLMAARY